MVSRGPLAQYLSEFSQSHRRIVQILIYLNWEKQGQALQITPEHLKQQVAEFIYEAVELDERFFREANRTAPLIPGEN
jgi:hypothetical protein